MIAIKPFRGFDFEFLPVVVVQTRGEQSGLVGCRSGSLDRDRNDPGTGSERLATDDLSGLGKLLFGAPGPACLELRLQPVGLELEFSFDAALQLRSGTPVHREKGDHERPQQNQADRKCEFSAQAGSRQLQRSVRNR